jgi:hypothetical protein
MNYKARDVDGSWAVEELHKTIREFNAETTRQTKQMLWLTRVIAGLTLVMLIGLGVQIYLAVYPPTVESTSSK